MGARPMESGWFLSQISFPEFLEQVQDGLYIVDLQRTIVFWNAAAEELTGFSAEQMVGRRCMDPDVLDHRTVFGESLCRDDTCPLLRCMSTDVGGTVPQLILMKTASGRPLPVSLSVGPLHGRQGESIGAIALFRSVREEYQQRKLAVEIQKRMITHGDFARGGAQVRTLYRPVDEIGGDFLEAFFIDERTLIATIADATGHGISASLFTMVYKTLLHAAFSRYREPGQVMGSINRGFMETAGVEGFYIGACLVSYDTESRSGRYSAAGHPKGLIFERSGDGYRLGGTLSIQSLMLGMDEETRFGEAEFTLSPGGFLMICSDGMLEAPCRDGKQFGVGGMERFFSHYAGNAPLMDLLADIQQRSAFSPLGDDASAIMLGPQ